MYVFHGCILLHPRTGDVRCSAFFLPCLFLKLWDVLDREHFQAEKLFDKTVDRQQLHTVIRKDFECAGADEKGVAECPFPTVLRSQAVERLDLFCRSTRRHRTITSLIWLVLTLSFSLERYKIKLSSTGVRTSCDAECVGSWQCCPKTPLSPKLSAWIKTACHDPVSYPPFPAPPSHPAGSNRPPLPPRLSLLPSNLPSLIVHPPSLTDPIFRSLRTSAGPAPLPVRSTPAAPRPHLWWAAPPSPTG